RLFTDNQFTRHPSFPPEGRPVSFPCPGPRVSRRRMIQVGAASVLGLSLPKLLRADDARKTPAHADACILVFLTGAPTHLDTRRPATWPFPSRARSASAAPPPDVHLPYMTKEGAGGPSQPGYFAGWLGNPRDPMIILKDPNAADFGLPELTLGPDIDPTRFDARRELEARLAATRSGAGAD